MKRLLALLFLSSCTAVAPLASNTPPPAPSATASAVPATPEPPIRVFHPVTKALFTANVLQAWCDQRTTTISEYAWGLVWAYDDTAKELCIASGGQ